MPGSTVVAPPDPGVPIVWSEEAGQRVLALAASGVPIYKIEAFPGMPNAQTIYEWRERRPEWAAALARARAVRAERLADEGLGLIDACDGDSSSQVTKAREQGAYRRWLAGCLDRATYGDAVQVAATVDVRAVVAFAGLAQRVSGEE